MSDQEQAAILPKSKPRKHGTSIGLWGVVKTFPNAELEKAAMLRVDFFLKIKTIKSSNLDKEKRYELYASFSERFESQKVTRCNDSLF